MSKFNIFLAYRNNSNFIVINKPNLPGFACDVKLVEFNFGQAEVGISNGLPNFIQSTFNNLEPRECQAEAECAAVEHILYPNPTTEGFQVRTEQRCFEPYVISLYTLSAQLLYQEKIDNNPSKFFSLKQFPIGLYLVEITFKNKKVVKKIIKQ